jgi:RimJ/RimL family protein N-acetyltransferase
MTIPVTPAEIWPFFDLSIKTPLLELRYANDGLLQELTTVAADVIAPGTRPFDGDATFFDVTPAGRRRWITGQSGARSRMSPSWWVLVFAVVIDGRAVGTQEMTASEFPRLRTVNTFSWLTRSHQGRGFGKEMRKAILHLAFDGLGAARAESEAFEDNPASLRVSESVGYRRNGTTWTLRQDEAAPMTRFLITVDDWKRIRREDITIHGLASCLPLLGL